MAVNGIRVSALPTMEVADLTGDDYIIVNDGNINTRRISFQDFIGAVNVNVSDLDVVESVNGLSGVVTLTNADVNAPSISEFIQLESTVQTNNQLTGTNTSAIAALNVRVTDNEDNIATNATNISTNAANIATNTTNITSLRTDVGTVTGANLQTQVTTISDTVGGGVNDSSGTPATHAVAITELREDLGVRPAGANSAFSMLATANAILDTHGQDISQAKADITANENAIAAIDTSGIATNAAAIEANEIAIAANETAIAELADGTTNLVTPSVNGVTVTVTGADLNQLDGVTLGSAASAETGDFASSTALADYSTTAEADALYAPISVTGADGDAAKAVTDAIGNLTQLSNASAASLTDADEIEAALNLIIGKVNAIITAGA